MQKHHRNVNIQHSGGKPASDENNPTCYQTPDFPQHVESQILSYEIIAEIMEKAERIRHQNFIEKLIPAMTSENCFWLSWELSMLSIQEYDDRDVFQNWGIDEEPTHQTGRIPVKHFDVSARSFQNGVQSERSYHTQGQDEGSEAFFLTTPNKLSSIQSSFQQFSQYQQQQYSQQVQERSSVQFQMLMKNQVLQPLNLDKRMPEIGKNAVEVIKMPKNGFSWRPRSFSPRRDRALEGQKNALDVTFSRFKGSQGSPKNGVRDLNVLKKLFTVQREEKKEEHKRNMIVHCDRKVVQKDCSPKSSMRGILNQEKQGGSVLPVIPVRKIQHKFQQF